MSNDLPTYKVEVKTPFPAERRVRAGIVVPVDGGYEGNLTKDQVAAIEQDEYLTISEATKAPAKSAPKKPAKK